MRKKVIVTVTPGEVLPVVSKSVEARTKKAFKDSGGVNQVSMGSSKGFIQSYFYGL